MSKKVEIPAVVETSVRIIDQAKTAADAKAYRVAKAVSQAEVAKQLSISPSMILKLELGQRNWSHAFHKNYVAAVDKVAADHARHYATIAG